MLKIGLLGAGSLGQTHILALQQFSGVEVVGVYDQDTELAQHICRKFGLRFYEDALVLMQDCDGIVIVSPLLSHPHYAELAIKNSKHVFLGQPFGSKTDLAYFMELSGEANVKVQLGFSERFNPAFQAALEYIEHPMYLELTRQISFDSASNSIPVVKDIMLGDIDMVVSLVKANIKKVSATGVNVFGESPDIVNAHLEFDNGAFANLTANRVSTKSTHEVTVYQPHALLHIDLLKQESSLLSRSLNTRGSIQSANPIVVKSSNKIETALESFVHAIQHHQEPWISLSDGLHALTIASMITDKILLVNSTV